MMFVVLFLVGAALGIGPWIPGVPLEWGAKVGISTFGAIIVVGVLIAAVFSKLYRKASASMAFVKTGMGGAVVIKDGGKVIFPVIHQIVPVSLETMRLN